MLNKYIMFSNSKIIVRIIVISILTKIIVIYDFSHNGAALLWAVNAVVDRRVSPARTVAEDAWHREPCINSTRGLYFQGKMFLRESFTCLNSINPCRAARQVLLIENSLSCWWNGEILRWARRFQSPFFHVIPFQTARLSNWVWLIYQHSFSSEDVSEFTLGFAVCLFETQFS